MNRRDPRIRQTIDRFTDTLETANLNTQASLWTFSESYLKPCLHSVASCLEQSCYPCIGVRRERIRARQRHLSRAATRGRPELVFDFYNDEWDEEPEDSPGMFTGWGADELDRLLAGSSSDQPRRQRNMTYGTRGVRRKSLAGKGGEIDPTIVPGSSMFGFLERLPWKIGGRVMRYKPSAADLREHPGRKGPEEAEGEALLDDAEEPVEDYFTRPQQRKRSGTTGSKSTTTSFSSRGDLFPSEDEADAVPLGDEFAITLGRRTTRSDEVSSRKSRTKRPSLSRTTSGSKDPKSPRSPKSQRSQRRQYSGTSLPAREVEEARAALEQALPSMEDLRREEQDAREQEEAEVERKREEAKQVALERGLSMDGEGAREVEILEDEDFDEGEELHIARSQPQPSPAPKKFPPLGIPNSSTTDTEPPELSPGSVD